MFDEQRANRQNDPVLAEFFGGTRTPTQAQIDYLTSCGVLGPALGSDADGGGYVIGAADIVLDGTSLFDFAGDEERESTTPALIFVARDQNGDPIDLVAWSPRTDRVASRFGRAAVLGEQALHDVRGVGDPFRIHRGVLDWLRGGRDGAVIVDPRRAGRMLLDAPDRLAAEDGAHAAEIAALMTASLHLERIVIPTRRAA